MPDMTVAKALAWASFYTPSATGDHCVQSLLVLAAEVRRLQAEQGGPCTTCQHDKDCSIQSQAGYDGKMWGTDDLFGCRAWEAKA